MTRTRLRAAVMTWSITAGVLCGVVGLLTAVPSGADADRQAPPAEQGTGAAPVAPAASSGRNSRGIPPASVVPQSGGMPGGRGTRRPNDWRWICEHWPYWPPWPMPPNPDDRNRHALFFGDAEVSPPNPPLAGVTASPSGATPGPGPTASLAAGGPPDPMSAGPGLAEQHSSANPPAGGPMPPMPPVPPPTPPLPTPPATRGPTAPPPAPQTAALADAAGAALPGLLGLAALTATGGALGYRQAKTGFALHAAGTARYLR